MSLNCSGKGTDPITGLSKNQERTPQTSHVVSPRQGDTTWLRGSVLSPGERDVLLSPGSLLFLFSSVGPGWRLSFPPSRACGP